MKNRLSQFMQFTVLVFAFTVVPGISSATSSINMIGENAVKVSFDDLDLSKPAGVSALYQRLRIASDQACEKQVGLREIIDIMNLKRKCAKTALAEAVRSIDNELLNKLHANGEAS